MPSLSGSLNTKQEKYHGNMNGPLALGVPGLSAYEVAVKEGFVGSVNEWLESLGGPAGGHYIPAVSQTDERNIEISFSPSNPGMPMVDSVKIALPVSESNGETTGISELPLATDKNLGVIKVGNNLTITNDGVLSVDTTDQMEQDNTLPITSAGVYATVGNIEALLKTI